ncbi:hypothetical protein BRADI_2g22592v3 [Brachypodium distachyon]|uniref:Knottin scorpion toxin-like domain-containing protein n=1 Tax=Brachypodium distachyon TaxID=15368 RepID=A0A0Q3IJ48_BRADI|nr:hypothetical protein BRADI_2g22592v3 [Brachypodium distachyon]
MGLTRKSMVSNLILCLLLVHSGKKHVPFLCKHTAKCRGHCRDRGFVDGRCDWSFPNLGVCECRYPNCKHRVAAAGPDPSRD